LKPICTHCAPLPFALRLIALSPFLLVAQSHGQELPVIGDQAPRPAVQRVEVGARQLNGTELRRNAIVAKQLYGREELDKYGDNNVLDVLKRLPGVNIQSGQARMRGLGAGYTQILLNGDPAPPGFALDQLTPTQVERIEVTKGPTADQSAQAVAGSINIILKEPPRVSQMELRVGANYNYDRPVGNANLTISDRFGAVGLSMPISVFEWRNQNEFQNQRFMPGSDNLPALSRQDGARLNWGSGFNIGPRLNWKISDEETLSFQSFANKGRWNNDTRFQNRTVSGMPIFDDDNKSYGTFQNVRGNFQWVNRFSDSQRIEVKLGLQDARNTFNTETYRFNASYLVTRGDNADQGVTQSGKYTQLLGEEHSLTAGWDFESRKREVTAASLLLGVPLLPQFDNQPFSAKIDRTAFFVQDEWEISPHWSTYFGVRNERIETKSRGTGATVSNSSSVLTPLWHLNYKFDPASRDMIRASLTRSYRAPDAGTLLARPRPNQSFTDLTQTNTELATDNVGNPALKPELATGLDVAYERYFSGGGLISIGGFYRRIGNLMRSVNSLEAVDYATAPRWVSRTVNFSEATTSGIELEVKGRAGELMPALFDPKLALSLRGSLNFYRSKVAALTGPDNRLDSQQPWSGTFGLDYRFSTLPLTVGGSLNYTPSYATQQSLSQTVDTGRSRALDMFAQLAVSKKVSVRLAVNNLAPLDNESRTLLNTGYFTSSNRQSRTGFGATLDVKL
jgi:outer membrane receptor for ferrienterochelin and colicins